MAESTHNTEPEDSTFSDVSEDLHKQLPSSSQLLSCYPNLSFFTFPAAIKNSSTNFLALGRCGPRCESFQLISSPEALQLLSRNPNLSLFTLSTAIKITTANLFALDKCGSGRMEARYHNA
ncbi:hypothetical protein BJX62DRAFT_242718 [Aspergillus germanicus]